MSPSGVTEHCLDDGGGSVSNTLNGSLRMDLETARRRIVRHACSFLFYVSQIANRPAAVISTLPEPAGHTRSLGRRGCARRCAVAAFVGEWHGHSGISIRSHQRSTPRSNGLIQSVIFGLIGWILMGLIFFPLIGLGPFAFQVGLGIAPALLSLAMLLTYSVVLATVYVTLDRWSPT